MSATERTLSAGSASTSFGPFVDRLGSRVWFDQLEPAEVVPLSRSGEALPFAYAELSPPAGSVTTIELAAEAFGLQRSRLRRERLLAAMSGCAFAAGASRPMHLSPW